MKRLVLVTLLLFLVGPFFTSSSASARDSAYMVGALTTDGNLAVAVFLETSRERCKQGRTVKYFRKDRNRKKRLVGNRKTDKKGFTVMLVGRPPKRGKVVISITVPAKSGCSPITRRYIPY